MVCCWSLQVSQSAPMVPKDGRDKWWLNPYHYPTVRSITSVAALKEKRGRLELFSNSILPQPSPSPRTPVQVQLAPSWRPKRTQPPKYHPDPNPGPFPVSHRRSNSNRRAAPLAIPLKSSKEPNPLDGLINTINGTKFFGIDVTNFETGNATAIGIALNDFIKTAENLVRELLVHTQSGLLKAIGQVDVETSSLQKRWQESTFRLALAGQRAAAKTYENLPPIVNKLVTRLTTPMDTSGRNREQIQSQLNDAVKNLRELKKMLVKAVEEHEKDVSQVLELN